MKGLTGLTLALSGKSETGSCSKLAFLRDDDDPDLKVKAAMKDTDDFREIEHTCLTLESRRETT